MASAFYESCVLLTASDVGVFAALAKAGAMDAAGVAAACGLHPRGAALLLDACVALELLGKTDGRYANTAEAAAFLVPGARGDLSGALRYNRDVYAAWGQLTELARTGRPVERPALHLGDDPARTRAFVLAMHGRALAMGRGAVPHVDLQGCRHLLDVGGGPATMAALLAQANPELRCSVMDLPAVADVARELLATEAVRDRIALIPGDYHTTAFPAGIDAILFSGVLHQEAPDAIRDLFTRAHAALVPGGRLYVIDMMTDASHTQPPFSALFAVNMALTTEAGWVFSDVELQGWLEGAGFGNFVCRPLPPPLPHWIGTARKGG